jgi:hypothetical protein
LVKTLEEDIEMNLWEILFYICDYGNTNGTNTLTQQFAITYSAPLTIVVASNEYVTV